MGTGRTPGWASRCTGSGFRTWITAGCWAPCPAVSGPARHWPPRRRRHLSCCSWTSRRTTWTRPPDAGPVHRLAPRAARRPHRHASGSGLPPCCGPGTPEAALLVASASLRKRTTGRTLANGKQIPWPWRTFSHGVIQAHDTLSCADPTAAVPVFLCPDTGNPTTGASRLITKCCPKPSANVARSRLPNHVTPCCGAAANRFRPP